MRKEHNPQVVEVDETVEIKGSEQNSKGSVKKPRKLMKKLVIEDDSTTS